MVIFQKYSSHPVVVIIKPEKLVIEVTIWIHTCIYEIRQITALKEDIFFAEKTCCVVLIRSV